ncbi:hypothetical protein SY83_03135 [Paenibacillus swuensis]|uniref:Uncharacterized protein n=1 Tax=Paenibacillus swuensis TaxID=1178515 RepID=A0A172TEK2_9BACL|nr:hypothetical protein [Paenibacillus swuensis]ANE45479.1 hypothetical protein SY83_03135 [Paenibacillus swuensis]
MRILTSSLFSEVNSFFSISHKVDLKIREELNDTISSDLQLNTKEKDMDFINLIVSTNKATLNVMVKGPEINRKDKFINWGLWLPYEAIVSSSNQVIPYLQFYFDALIILLGSYGIPEKRIREIQVRVESEIIGNSAYDYEEDDFDLDLSELN